MAVLLSESSTVVMLILSIVSCLACSVNSGEPGCAIQLCGLHGVEGILTGVVCAEGAREEVDAGKGLSHSASDKIQPQHSLLFKPLTTGICCETGRRGPIRDRT